MFVIYMFVFLVLPTCNSFCLFCVCAFEYNLDEEVQSFVVFLIGEDEIRNVTITSFMLSLYSIFFFFTLLPTQTQRECDVWRMFSDHELQAQKTCLQETCEVLPNISEAAVLLSIGTDQRAGRNVVGIILNGSMLFSVLLGMV